MSENIISKLKTNKKFLTNVESKIAELILCDPKKFITYSMHDLAKAADVSQGSIINFSKKFANGGFPDLKLQIAASISNSENRSLDIVSNRDSIKDALAKNIEAYKTAFELTKEVNDEKTLERVVTRILKAKKVEIYGIFQSAAVATDFCYQLLQLGIPASFVSDILTCSISAFMLDESSLVIAISSSGKTKDVIDAVKNAKANNVPVVSITSNINSPLAKLSDDVLIASSSGSSVNSSTTEVRSSQILLTDTICSYIRSRMDRSDENWNLDLKKILNSHNVEEGENE